MALQGLSVVSDNHMQRFGLPCGEQYAGKRVIIGIILNDDAFSDCPPHMYPTNTPFHHAL